MSVPFRVQVQERGDGGWCIAAGPWFGRAHPVEIEAAEVARVWALAGALEALGEEIVPPPELAWAAAERALGLALGALFDRSSAVRTALREASAAAVLRDEGLAMFIDATSERVRALPWELLMDVERDQYFEALGTAVVLRVGPAPAVGHEPTDVAMWSAAGWTAEDDAASRAYVAEVMAELAQRGIEVPERADPNAALLHLVAHGDLDASRLQLALSAGAVPPETVVHGLRDRLAASAMVALGVCYGGANPPELADLLLQAGAPTVLAPARSMAVEVAAPFHAAFAAALVGGCSLGAATAAGRRRLRTEAFPFAEGRWYAMRLSAADVRVACWVHGRARDAWWPSSWPPARRDAVDALRQAREVAVEMGQGFLGVEHLLAVLPGKQPAFRVWSITPEDLRRAYEYVEASDGAAREPRITPRLLALLAELPPGYSATELFRLLQREAVAVLRRVKRELSSKLFDERDAEQTHDVTNWGGRAVHDTSVVWEMRQADGLEVVGGPEDGRVVRLPPGQVVGRWASELRCDVALYEGGQVRDLSLPRRAARRTEQGELEVYGRGGRAEIATPTRSGCLFLSASTAVLPVRLVGAR